MSDSSIIYINGFDETRYDVSALLFDGQKIVLGGKYLDEDTKLRNQEGSFLFLSNNDGDWKLKSLGKGSLMSLKSVDYNLYVVKHISLSENFSKIDSSILSVSYDYGNSWRDVVKLPFYVRDVFCISKDILFIICYDVENDPANWFIMRSLDGGTTWTVIKQINYNTSLKTYQDDKSLYIITYNDTYSKLIQFGKEEIKEVGFELPRNNSIDAFIKTNDLFYIVTRNDNDELFFLCYENSTHKFSIVNKISQQGFVAESLNFYNNIISVLVNRTSGFGVKTSIFYSISSGKEWKEIEIPINHYFQPFSFFKNKFFGYSGLGRIQVIEVGQQE